MSVDRGLPCRSSNSLISVSLRLVTWDVERDMRAAMANLSTERAHDFVNALLQRSEEGKVPWAAFEHSDGFYFQGTGGAVVIRSRDNDGSMPFVLEVLDESGSVSPMSPRQPRIRSRHCDFHALFHGSLTE